MSWEPPGRREWERRYDEAATLVASRRLSKALAALHKLHTWQRRGGYDSANYVWHDAEIFWLQGVALERARRRVAARAIWRRLAILVAREQARYGWRGLPFCRVCVERNLPFAPSWHTVSKDVTLLLGDEAVLIEYFGDRVRQYQ